MKTIDVHGNTITKSEEYPTIILSTFCKEFPESVIEKDGDEGIVLTLGCTEFFLSKEQAVELITGLQYTVDNNWFDEGEPA